MAIVDEIERIKTNIANAYTEIENKGVVTTGVKNSDNLASTISAIQTGGTGGGGDTPEKGLIIKGWDNEGFATEIEVVGMTTLPNSYLRYLSYPSNYGCKAKLKIPKDLTYIGDYNFYNATYSELSIPDGVTHIGNYALGYTNNLKSLKLPSKLTSVGESTFYNSAIEVLDFPVGITTLPQKCCYQSKAKVVIFRGAISSLGNQCFYYCPNIEVMIFTKVRDYPYYPQVQSQTFSNAAIGAIYVPDEYVTNFQNGTNWSSVKSKVKPLSELPDEYKELL